MKKRIFSFLLAIALIFSCVPVSHVHAAETTENTPIISVESKYAAAGAQVEVNVNITNNPGIAGAKITATFSDKLTLTGAVAGSTFASLDYTEPASLTSGCAFNWDSLDAVVTEDGTLLTLTFTVSEDAAPNEVLDVDISYRSGDIYNGDLEDVEFEIVNGTVTVIDYIPGDVNSDKVVNGKDVTLIRRYNAGHEVSIREDAADVNDDNVINGKDVTLIRRFNAGFDVTLKPHTPRCSHTMEAIAYKAATCTEDGNVSYYHCTTCDKYYNDESGTLQLNLEDTVLAATGHTEVIDEYVAPTYESNGLEQGSHCSVCNEVIIAQIVIPPLEKDAYNIVYNLDYNDSYLQSIEIVNPNPASYTTQDGLVLAEPQVEGYVFEGWYDGQGSTANKVTEIPAGQTGEKTLWAHWSKVEYTLKFNSPLTEAVETQTYTVDTGATLTNPKWYGYTFVGWTDESGNLVTGIPVGTAKNITLTANWTSKRNQTIPVATLDDPLIIEDEERGLILFVYEIGRVENIPLFVIKDFGNSTGITWTEEVTVEEQITNEHATEVAETIAEATTRSSSWTLSEGWNKYTEQSETHSSEVSQEVSQNAKSAYEKNGQWTISKSSGGSSTVSQETGVSAKVSATVGSEVEVDSGIGVKGSVSAEVGSEVGTDYTDTTENSKTWNTDTGYAAGYSASMEREVSYSVSASVSNEYGYTQSYGSSSEWSQSNDVGVSKETSREYGSSVVYSTGITTTTTRTYTNEGAVEGYYRLVAAGTAHVFGVVGYDMATRSYFTYTYTVMDDEVKDFVDYSATTSAFDDQENGVLPFDVPFDVNVYVDNRIVGTNGLTVDLDTGVITGYTGTATHVRVPTYMSVDNGDGTSTVVKVTGIEATAFSGNTNIVEVTLPETVTEIPDSAFAGCTSLTNVIAKSITKIGSNAFQNCTALENYEVTTAVTTLGDNAFAGANSVTINAYDANVAKAAANSGAKNLTINLSSMVDELSDYTFTIGEETEYFALFGGTKTYTGVRVESNAAETVLNGMTLTGCTDTPLVISSEKVTLNRVNVTASGLTMVLSADTANVALFGNNTLVSSSADSVRTNNIVLTQVNTSVASKLSVTGNVLVCGTCTNEVYLPVTNGKIIYYNLTDTCLVTFDANGGTCDEDSRVVSCGTAIGELPEASNTGYVFYGWADADGNVITADTMIYASGEMTLYARWIEPYTINWNVGVGYTISVSRTDSPKGNASIGTLSAGDSIYPGDVLTIEYAATTGYSITESGATAITVEGNVTAEQIYAVAQANSYTYNIVYVSSNGTALGTATVTYPYNTANTIEPKTFAGYTSPASQTVEWDSVTAKTITFTYTPTAVATSQKVASGTWWYYDSDTGITYVTKVEYQNRTASSVQIRVVWTNTITNGRYGYTQTFKASSNGVSTGTVTICSASTWNTSASGSRSKTVYSGWITVPLNTTNQTSITISGTYDDAIRDAVSWSGTYKVPAY